MITKQKKKKTASNGQLGDPNDYQPHTGNVSSGIWKAFHIAKDGQSMMCLACLRCYVYNAENQSTSPGINHLKANIDCLSKLGLTKEEVLEKNKSKQLSTMDMFTTKLSNTKQLTQLSHKEWVLRFLVDKDLPPNVLDSLEYQMMIKTAPQHLNAGSKPLTADIARRAIRDEYIERDEKLINELKDVKNIAISLDYLTKNTVTFLGVIGSYFTKDLDLRRPRQVTIYINILKIDWR
ncbi:hypothetical protein SAMD00019534_125510, partial [Acytostelium subglobosum LB1]|uniref:hypothetical protein n=1 Tax=Acytostelium subglobosum LB1 TaxID=1410327 RepID=UPI000645081D